MLIVVPGLAARLLVVVVSAAEAVGRGLMLGDELLLLTWWDEPRVSW